MRSTVREIRRTLHGARRLALDIVSGERRRIVAPGVMKGGMNRGAHGDRFDHRLVIEQSAGGTAHADAKRHNITIAARAINGVAIEPGRVFSFWRIVGRPAPRRGFVPGRSLVRGRVELDHGGGLCQLSGMLYYLALVGGLGIAERHPHTRDIYTEETRYAPLGADAAVAYGLKDLRIANTLGFAVRFSIDLDGERLRCALLAPEPLAEHHVRFDRTDRRDGVRAVETWRSPAGAEMWEHLGCSLYTVPADH